ncbi:hypothetical protein BZZ01_04910 [Nostocales cyanobacterium HT-58-2]|nr:hypothetical protein BZZ01_04910 [Nostocales cyanobacterium HT-58-2]
MGLTLEIDARDIQKASDRLRGIALRASDITNAGEGIRLILQADVDYRFLHAPATETGGEVYGGERWEALSEAYLVARPERLGGQILRDTGELQQSLTASGSPNQVFSVTNTDLIFGTALPKAVGLQKKRPFLFWHPLLIEKVAEYLANYLGG